MKRQGFTLVELLVVIAIIALLMGILMPALARVRQLAFRLTCGTNLSGIGKAMLIYAHDYEDELPRAGGRDSDWGAVTWNADHRRDAYGLGTDGTGGNASISSCFYLLVKYTDVTPKSFLCKGDTGTSEFTLADEDPQDPGFELIDAWDFGATPEDNCSYSYHAPFSQYALTTSSEPGLAVAADRNPWLKTPGADPDPTMFADFVPDIDPFGGATEDALKGNAITHQGDGQNVLFLDGHVDFAKRAYCSLEDDNIYTRSDSATGKGSARGVMPTATAGNEPANRKDSLLLHDTGVTKVRRCFTAYTPVWVNGTLTPICAVTAGQTVGQRAGTLAVGCGVLSEIEAVQVHPGQHPDCYDVVLETGERISVVGSHLFGVDTGLWLPVEQLAAGMCLRSLGGGAEIVEVTKRLLPYEGTVYNLEIKDADAYFVGAAGVEVRDF